MRDTQAPYPLIEFDAHKAARIYAEFARALLANKAGIVPALQARRTNAIALAEAHGRTEQAARMQTTHDPERALRWAVDVCQGKAEPLAASLGRAWLPERTILTLLRMESGHALAALLETGDLWRATGIDRPKM